MADDSWEALARDAIELLKEWDTIITDLAEPDESNELGTLIERLNALVPPELPYR